MSNNKIAVIGGDCRQAFLAAFLAESGYECAVFAIDGEDIGGAVRCGCLNDAVTDASALVLPLPVSRDGVNLNAPLYSGKIPLDQIRAVVPDTTLITGGMLKQSCFPNNKVCDYYAKEELQLLNTIPTAEGAIAIAMEKLPTTLHGTKTLIMGFGRVGKTLALMLKGLGAEVEVATRNTAEKAVCRILGFTVVEYGTLSDKVSDYGLIYNTVPALLLNDDLLCRVQNGTPVIDLATHPGGVDASAAVSRGKAVIWALGLPAKVAPITAGEYISKTVLGILREENIV